jgi:5'-nucleotidase
VRSRLIAIAGALTLALLAGCSSDSDGSGSGSTTTTAKAEVLRILVTNDDGYSHVGLDAVVEALRKLPDVEVTVSAPAENKSGTGSQTTTGEVTATELKTKSGYPATAVNGFPADSVAYGLANVVTEPPHLVVSGINEGQNLGPIASISGTVGAAKAAAAAGIPAFAASQGLGEGIEYSTAAQYVVDWVTAHRAGLLDGDASKDIVNLNVPTCPTGSVRGLQQQPLSSTGNGLAPATDCESTATEFTGDVDAFLAGFATVTELDSAGATVTSSTTWPAEG